MRPVTVKHLRDLLSSLPEDYDHDVILTRSPERGCDAGEWTPAESRTLGFVRGDVVTGRHIAHQELVCSFTDWRHAKR